MPSNTALKPDVGPSFFRILREHGFSALARDRLRELQINVGKLCNQACNHCHVDAGPKRTEIMTWETMERILHWSGEAQVSHADITGGAPELNPHFRSFVEGFEAIDAQVTSRCNLTVLFEPGQEDLARWYADHRVRLVCSLPCYSKKNVDQQRGKGVFNKSIMALHVLNQHGYGKDPTLPLDLVYNPGGAFLPPEQTQLEAEYRQRLGDDFGVHFSNLLTITNLPINRFAHFLDHSGQSENYQHLLVDNFNPATVNGLMCRHLISVDWRGQVYDCDFNQMLDIPLGGGATKLLWQLDANGLGGETIAVDRHCFGCTAGSGSSCGGALV